MESLVEILERFASPRVALVGDFMLDRYVYGNVDRLSPDAPVPVLNVVDRQVHPGGASRVAAAVLALGAEVACVGVVGRDEDAETLVRELGAADTTSLMRLGGRCTAVKSRYIGLAQHRHAQHLVRVDEEAPGPLADEINTRLAAALRSHVSSCRMVALQDHDKGVVTDRTGPELISVARKAGVPVVVDPARIRNYRRYRGASLLTPNRYEAQLAGGIEITDEASMERAARRIMQTTEADAVVITLDKHGAFLLDGDGNALRCSSRHPRNVYDVAGAGDEVLAMLAVALANDCELPQAVELANIAAGLEVEHFGFVPVTRAEALGELYRMVGLRGRKVVSRDALMREATRRRRRGETIVFTNGCFDLLHVGHVRCLKQARRLGSCLVVAINSDDSVRRLKGAGHPVIGADERAEMLGSLECVDYVTIFDEDTPEALLELLKPELLVKGGTTPVVVGREIVEAYGGAVRTLELVEGLSTTEIIDRIIDNHGAEKDAAE